MPKLTPILTDEWIARNADAHFELAEKANQLLTKREMDDIVFGSSDQWNKPPIRLTRLRKILRRALLIFGWKR